MQEDTKYILEGVTQLVPSLKAAEVVGAWAGLRPVRPSARLEPETLQVLAGPRPTPNPSQSLSLACCLRDQLSGVVSY
jgi:glycerol-3-phosphate dehydrogenase